MDSNFEQGDNIGLKTGEISENRNRAEAKGKEKLAVPDFIRDIRKGRYSLDMAIAEVLNYCQMKTIPVNVWAIARTFGFEVFEAEFINKSRTVSGLMFDSMEELQVGNKKAKRAIVLNKKFSKEIQAFTIAHEIGHFALHCSEETDFYEAVHITKDKKEDLTEKEKEEKKFEDAADAFAAALLMPAQKFREMYQNFITTRSLDETITALMTIFVVEKEAVWKRIEELEIKLPDGVYV